MSRRRRLITAALDHLSSCCQSDSKTRIFTAYGHWTLAYVEPEEGLGGCKEIGGSMLSESLWPSVYYTGLNANGIIVSSGLMVLKQELTGSGFSISERVV